MWFTGSSYSQQIPNVIKCNGISFISSFISCTTTVYWIQHSWSNVIFHDVITICQQSCQKVDLNISQVSVILLGGVGNITNIMHSSLDSRPMGTPPSLDIRHGSTVLPCYWHLVVITGNLFKFVHLRPYHPPIMTSSGGHWSGQYTSYWNAVLFDIVSCDVLQCFDKQCIVKNILYLFDIIKCFETWYFLIYYT